MTPTLLGAVVIFAPKWCSWVADRWAERHPPEPQPIGPPIEQLAADLRRLLRLHAELNASAQAAMRAHRVWAVEAAIRVRALEAAKALDVSFQEPDGPGGPPRGDLCGQLRALAAAGLVLPEKVGPFVGNGRF
jgi:hypothetical protein